MVEFSEEGLKAFLKEKGIREDKWIKISFSDYRSFAKDLKLRRSISTKCKVAKGSKSAGVQKHKILIELLSKLKANQLEELENNSGIILSKNNKNNDYRVISDTGYYIDYHNAFPFSWINYIAYLFEKYPDSYPEKDEWNIYFEIDHEEQSLTMNNMSAEEGKFKKYVKQLKESKNIIFHGAPGTGKTYLARKIAAYIIGEWENKNYEEFWKEYEEARVNIEDSEQYEFVQFHPSYDYTDFIEGLRPRKGDSKGAVSFELKDGVFKAFVKKAVEEGHEKLSYIFIIDEINRGEISRILGELFFSVDPGYRGKRGAVLTQYSNMYDDVEKKKFPKLYIPENVYIIGTMNDIDRSVDSFDFAMRRRFRFLEITANSTIDMLDSLGEKVGEKAKKRMTELNKVIENTEGLGVNYQIGAAYFMNLKNLNEENQFEELWSDYLEPLLHDYVRGLPDDNEILNTMKKAYDLNLTSKNDKSNQEVENVDGSDESQG